MPRWNKNAREFEVRVNPHGLSSHLCRIPKPIMEMFDCPKTVKFALTGKQIVFSPGDKE